MAEDAVALDVGANIGVTSLILSERLRSGRVFAFEPGETVFQLLQENLKNNAVSNVDAYHQAVSDKTQRSGFSKIQPLAILSQTAKAIQYRQATSRVLRWMILWADWGLNVLISSRWILKGTSHSFLTGRRRPWRVSTPSFTLSSIAGA
nr:FkbM family methyltransferase [Verrucomicrobium spinosum]